MMAGLMSEISATHFDDKKITKKENLDFVFEIRNNDRKETSASEELSLEDDKTLEDFWSSINEKEDFINDIDAEVIKSSLKPILQLPIENLEAALPRKIRYSKKPLSVFQQDPITLPNSEVRSSEK